MEKHIYEIKVVSNQTGLSPFTIRAWENRYNAVSPFRTDTNRRLYSDEDIKKLKLLNTAVKLGHSISNVAKLNVKELLDLTNDNSETPEESISASVVNQFQNEIENSKKAILELDGSKFENILLESTVKYSQPDIINKFLIPLLFEIGRKWQEGTFRITHEHLATQVIRNFLLNIISGYRFEDNAPKAIIATPSGQKHELGALIGAVVFASQGWKPVYLGPDLPSTEIAYSANILKPKAIYLSIIHSKDDPKIQSEILNVVKLLENEVHLILSGNDLERFSPMLKKSGALIVNAPEELKQTLANI
jgi:DNA-binding transcriptional MerR regulator